MNFSSQKKKKNINSEEIYYLPKKNLKALTDRIIVDSTLSQYN